MTGGWDNYRKTQTGSQRNSDGLSLQVYIILIIFCCSWIVKGTEKTKLKQKTNNQRNSKDNCEAVSATKDNNIYYVIPAKEEGWAG